MAHKKFRVQINFEDNEVIFKDTSKGAEVDMYKKAFFESKTAQEFKVFVNVGEGYKMVESRHKRRIGF